MSLESYENDFIKFQSKLPELRKSNPDKFIAFIDGNVSAVGESIEEIKDKLEKKGIEPSGIVIEFVSKNEIRMIV